jgi:hypothetical protein
MKATALVVLFVLAMGFSAGTQANEELYGTWRLVSFTGQRGGTGESRDMWGPAPQGYLTYGRDGRMSGIMVKANRPKPADLAKMTDQERAELFKSMVAYAGTFKVEGSRVVHNIDISWNENWTGMAQVRNFRIEGRRLIISLDPQIGTEGTLIIAVLTWEKVQ